MRLDRRTLIAGAVAMAALAALSARATRREACPGGPCCLPLPGPAAFSANVWASALPANQPPAPTPAQVFTNRTQ
jgi:hypothetical protein